MKVFDKYSAYYDLLYEDKDYTTETEYIDMLIKQYHPNASSVLDLGCGTGKHAHLLSKKGYQVHGVDVSESMLDLAKQYIDQNTTFSLGDIRSIRLPEKFDVVISLFHVSSYQTSNQDLVQAITTAHEHLKPNGLYIFDCWYGPAVLTTLPEIRIKRMTSTNVSLLRIAEPVLDVNNNLVTVNYELIINDTLSNTIDTLNESHQMRYLFVPEIKLLLSQSGFNMVDYFEFKTGKPLSTDTWNACFIAKATNSEESTVMPSVLLVLAHTRGISTFPAVYQSAIELKKRNFRVEILTGSPCDDDSLNKYFDAYHHCNAPSEPGIDFYSNFVIKNNFDIVIAYEPRDAINLMRASKIKKSTKFVYYNLEVLHPCTKNLSEHAKEAFLQQKYPEIIYNSNSTCLVIQDTIRAKLLQKNGINNEKTYLIPNSYYFAYNSQNIGNPNNRSLIFAGGLADWSIEQISNSLTIFKDIDITFSGWFFEENYANTIRQRIKDYNNITLIEKKFTLTEYTDLISKHGIGFVWYSCAHSWDGITFIGRSSGKFFMYLSCGKPVIVQNLPGIAQDVQTYGLGIVIDRLEQLPEAVEEISNNYEFYQTNILKSYPQYFDYAIASKAFFDYLKETSS